MKIYTNKSTGFTLLELLVVIAIIGILSSVVLASVNSARDSARSTALKSEANELIKLAQLHFFETGTFSTFASPGWISSEADCESRIRSTATNEANAESICKSMVQKIPYGSITTTDYYMYFGANEGSMVGTNNCTNATCFALNVKVDGTVGEALSGSDTWYCTSSEGNKADDHEFSHTDLGCERNP